MKLHELTLRTVRLPLIRPYVLSYRTFTEFEPITVEVRDGDGRIGWGEGHISPGSSGETRGGGLALCRHPAAPGGRQQGRRDRAPDRDRNARGPSAAQGGTRDKVAAAHAVQQLRRGRDR